MSRVSSDISRHEADRVARHRARMRAESLWSDRAARRFLDVLDRLEEEDKAYGAALKELNAQFDEAKRYLGPVV